MDLLKDEFGALKKISKEMEDEILLFNYSVFGTTSWSDQARKQLVFTEDLRSDLVGSVSNLFEKIEVLGHFAEIDGIKKPFLLAKDQL